MSGDSSNQPIREAIILAGGLGTRLRGAVPDLPKCMAPVAGKPFLSYLIDYFLQAGVERFIFALGYKSELFERFLQQKMTNAVVGGPGGSRFASYELSIEKEPLGTGGAILAASALVEEGTAMVLNGDTLFHISPAELSAFHRDRQADCTLCLKPMQNFDRYGKVELDEAGRVSHFREKQFVTAGLINGGIYALDLGRFLEEPLPEKFSFEKDYLEKYAGQRRLFGLVQDDYFIDIGIPEDYERAQQELDRPDGMIPNTIMNDL